MRADSHYVEQFDSTAPTQIIRVLPIDRISMVKGEKPLAPTPLVESIRRHGVLQPLLVQHARDGYRLIAGGKRLAAATAAGMSTVPCLVHHVEDDEAERLATASNPAVEADDAAGQSRAVMVTAQRTASELARSLARIGSCSGLLESAELTQQVLSGIVRVEACRSWCLAHALTLVAGAVNPKPVRMSAKAIGRRVLERADPERRVRSASLETRASVRDATDVVADVELLIAVLTGTVLAAMEGGEDATSEPVTLSIDVKAGTHVVFGVSRRSSADAMSRGVTPFADLMRQAAETLAGLLGGRLVPVDGHETVAQIELPLATSN